MKKYTQNCTAICIVNSVISTTSLIGLFYFLSLIKNPSSYDELIYFSHSILGIHNLSLPVSRSSLAPSGVERAWMLVHFFAFYLKPPPSRELQTLWFSSFLRMSRTSLTQFSRCCQCLTKHLGKVTGPAEDSRTYCVKNLRKKIISLSKDIFPFSQHILLLFVLQYAQSSPVYAESFVTTTKAIIFRAKSTMEVEMS